MTRTDNYRPVFITNLLSLYGIVGVWILCVLVDLPTSSINYCTSALILQHPSTLTYGEARKRISSTSTILFQSSKASQKPSSSISSPTIKTKVNNSKGKNSSLKSNTRSRSKTQFIPAAAKTASNKSPSSRNSSSSSSSSNSTSSNNSKKKSWFSYSDSVAASSSQASTSKSTSTSTISPPPPSSTGTKIDETEKNNKKPLFDDDLLHEEPYDVATRLLGLLLQRREDEVDRSFDGILKRLTPSYWTGRQRQAKRIESLIEQIQDLGDVRKNKRKGILNSLFGGRSGGGGNDRRKRVAHTYDPSTCLIGGGFFCTLYFYTPNDPNAPDPLWEQLSFKKENVKGQQYYERNDFREAVINYSEVWGPDLYITAEGTFKPVDFVTPNVTSSMTSDTTSTTKGSWPSFGGGNNGGQDMQNWQQTQSDRTVPGSQTLRTCPDIFQVDASGGSIHCETLGIQVPLPIVGSSNLVVVYADPRLRILLSPISSETAFGNWEESGLVVVQV
eukprot:CAMPEP_0113498354 /NCGR_PEP_ID=MMETSP0014_2-20120614/31123_1 /TAXON_ID=2857 /ORGANISM="Nitzschia sp." /LENGTH=501 /DNA_ID=CAMNT_0000392363 /DNA_START=59 /DNA_END=1561 /DNA_ORIENTATION=+ /assembly_acc=CAM_ASM_000159